MFRWLHIVISTLIVAFWITMNLALVERQWKIRNLDGYRQGVTHFLGNELSRERWMGIYRKHRKIGYTGFTLRRLYEGDSPQYRMEIETKLAANLIGQGTQLHIEGEVLLDHDMVPETLSLEVRLDQGGLTLTGERQEDSFVLTGESGGIRMFRLPPLPLKALCFSNGLTLELPVAGFEAGQTYEIPVFDPIQRTSGIASVEVKERTQRKINGLAVDCFHLETHFQGLTTQSWVTAEGETLRQQIPPPIDVVLVSEKKENAIRDSRTDGHH